MSDFRFNKVFSMARSVKEFLWSPKNNPRPLLPGQRRTIRQEISQLQNNRRAAEDPTERAERRKRIKELKRELRITKEWAASGAQTGALPDFIVIGAQRCGTTSLYGLLTQHPHVEPAAKKELHFFDRHFDEGVEWYRRRFPRPRRKDGHNTITGEATPYYMFHPHVAERMAGVVPHARLIALLRNPVDRAYSHYQRSLKKGYETLGFEEATRAEEARLRGERDKMPEDQRYVSSHYHRFSYLSRGIYVDQLLRWSEFFSEEQILVLKSEDFFERTPETLKAVLSFLNLPDWRPESPQVYNNGGYEREIDPITRRQLTQYFEPHNRRLYEHLGMDFGW